jgi:predicted nucleotidyltransferase
MNVVMDSKYKRHLLGARQRLLDRELDDVHRNQLLAERAASDVGAIVEMIVIKYAPHRIYQWGSLLRSGAFKPYSDIDIAVEGILDAERFFALLEDVQKMTVFPVDLVQLEKIAPEYADDIRRNGKVLYEYK